MLKKLIVSLMTKKIESQPSISQLNIKDRKILTVARKRPSMK